MIAWLLLVAGCGNSGGSGAKNAAIDGKNWPVCTDLKEKTVYDEFFAKEEFGERLLLAGKVSSALEDLEKSRKAFQDEGDLKEIFPMLLFYQVRESLHLVMKPKVRHKTEHLQILLNTYDAYANNRRAFDAKEPDTVDKQWRTYFDAAAKAYDDEDWSPEEGVDVLLEGVNAHVFYDLPRAVRDAVKENDAPKDELFADFTALDAIYPIAEERLKKDVLMFFEDDSEVEAVQKLYGNGAEYVRFSRGKAWEMGIGSGPLGIMEQQPHLDHDSDSRKYFPKELLERGICRK